MSQQRGRKIFSMEVPTSTVKDIIKEARAIPFPWEAIPDNIRSWLQVMAGATNTRGAFLLLGALTMTSCLMGPNSTFEVRPRHHEPCNLYTVCLCEPGTGKTQAYKIAVEEPLGRIPTAILVHDYT